MTISLFRRTSAHGVGDSADRPGPRHARVATEPAANSLPSSLGGLRRLENGLRKVLPQPLARSLFTRLAPLPSANKSSADSARSPHEDAGAGHAPVDNRGARFSSTPGPDLVELAAALVDFENETVRYLEIGSILDKCETGRAAMNDDLAHAVFRAIASFQDTPRGELLDRALHLVCRDPNLNVSAQTLVRRMVSGRMRASLQAHVCRGDGVGRHPRTGRAARNAYRAALSIAAFGPRRSCR